ncbi:hypothetical protein B0H13DRAFT_2328045 [Mycena leptocephala]|nr:hypothetical protein B0H13DRAFT_2328045 [Mycena leptocephala]
MSPKTACEILKKGRAALKNQVKKCRDTLLERLKKEKKKISATDEAWLDHGANHIEEDLLLDKLEMTSKVTRKEALEAVLKLRSYLTDVEQPTPARVASPLGSKLINLTSQA